MKYNILLTGNFISVPLCPPLQIWSQLSCTSHYLVKCVSCNLVIDHLNTFNVQLF